MASTKLNGSNIASLPEQPGNLETDIAQLTALLQQDVLSGDDDANVTELLKRLENADNMAEGVELRLDEILGKLDGLITSLEVKEEETLKDQPSTVGHGDTKSHASS